ncbi:MAG TPA: class I SAM-dependent methyltransferase [Cyanobacteria bacterium UBA11372]|nr:class I SAM-dependent methyltransferase [Cyanobacteria bacterium UBA11372]
MTENIFELKETIESWDDDYYHPIAEGYYDRAIPTMLRLMEVQPGATVLDGGCGPGVHSIRVAKEGYRVCAIDFSQAMLQEAKARVERAGMSHAVEFKQEDLTNLSFEDGSFQYVFSWGVIIHIREIEKALDNLARIVAPGGKLALYVTNKTALDRKIEFVARFLLRKPLSGLSGLESLSMGDGIWYEMHGEKLWVWQIDSEALTKYLEARGFRLKHRLIGEFTEIQRRVSGKPRELLLHLNNLCYSLKITPAIAVTNLFVFEKIS